MTTSDRKALGKKPMLPPDYIDPEITGDDRQMLETFYVVCRSEGGTADEIHLRGLRAVLARWGHPAPVAAEGEVGVLIQELQDAAFDLNGSDPERAMLYRAADLLQRQTAPVPVPVSERLPEEPLAWWFTPEGDEDYGWWVLEPDGMERCPQPTHWLPAHALPLPEVTP